MCLDSGAVVWAAANITDGQDLSLSIVILLFTLFPLSTSPTLVFLKHAFCKPTNGFPKTRVLISVTVYDFSSVICTCGPNTLEKTKTRECKNGTRIVFSNCNVFSRIPITCQIMPCFLAG